MDVWLTLSARKLRKTIVCTFAKGKKNIYIYIRTVAKENIIHTVAKATILCTVAKEHIIHTVAKENIIRTVTLYAALVRKTPYAPLLRQKSYAPLLRKTSYAKRHIIIHSLSLEMAVCEETYSSHTCNLHLFLGLSINCPKHQKANSLVGCQLPDWGRVNTESRESRGWFTDSN